MPNRQKTHQIDLFLVNEFCSNLTGFTCSCDADYVLSVDKHTCKVAQNREEMRVYVSNRNRMCIDLK